MNSKDLERPDDIIRLPADAAALVPHKPPMRLVDRLLEVKELESLSEMTVRQDMIFVDEDGFLDGGAYAEIIAQSLAAMEGYQKLGRGEPRQQGLLLGMRNIQVFGRARTGDILRVSVSKIAKYGDFGIVRGEIRNGDTLIANGEVKVWQGAV